MLYSVLVISCEFNELRYFNMIKLGSYILYLGEEKLVQFRLLKILVTNSDIYIHFQ